MTSCFGNVIGGGDDEDPRQGKGPSGQDIIDKEMLILDGQGPTGGHDMVIGPGSSGGQANPPGPDLVIGPNSGATPDLVIGPEPSDGGGCGSGGCGPSPTAQVSFLADQPQESGPQPEYHVGWPFIVELMPDEYSRRLYMPVRFNEPGEAQLYDPSQPPRDHFLLDMLNSLEGVEQLIFAGTRLVIRAPLLLDWNELLHQVSTTFFLWQEQANLAAASKLDQFVPIVMLDDERAAVGQPATIEDENLSDLLMVSLELKLQRIDPLLQPDRAIEHITYYLECDPERAQEFQETLAYLLNIEPVLRPHMAQVPDMSEPSQTPTYIPCA